MKKYLSFIVTIMLIILGFSYSVYAAEDIFELNVKSQTTNLHRGDEITLPIMLENINVVSGEQGVAVVQGTLSYEKEVFEVVKFEATNFELMANDDMIVSNSKDGYVVKQNTEIGKVTLKVKDDAKYGNTELSFINITGAIPNSISGRSTALKLNITEVVQPTAVTLTDIIISKNPNKTEYKVGEKFDATGMIVTAKYSDGTSKAVTNYTYEPNDNLTENDKQISIIYKEGSIEKSTVVAITVKKVEEQQENPKQEDNQQGENPKQEDSKQEDNQQGENPKQEDNKQDDNQQGENPKQENNKQEDNQQGESPKQEDNKQEDNQQGENSSQAENKKDDSKKEGNEDNSKSQVVNVTTNTESSNNTNQKNNTVNNVSNTKLPKTGINRLVIFIPITIILIIASVILYRKYNLLDK